MFIDDVMFVLIMDSIRLRWCVFDFEILIEEGSLEVNSAYRYA